MNARSLLFIALLVTLFSILSVALGLYNQTQRALSLEGNNLYSSRSISVSTTGAELESLLARSGTSARIFQELPGDTSVRAVIETGHPDPLPLHSGRQLQAGDVRAALVGADVKVNQDQGVTTYEFQGILYPVVGYLGLHANSLVSRTVLLQGPGLFDDTAASRMIVDGSNIDDAVLERLEPAPAAAAGGGTDRRTNIDFVSPVLLRFGWILTVLGAIATGLLAASQSRRLNVVLFQLGARRLHILIRSVVRLLLWMTLPLLLIFGTAAVLSGPMQSTGALLLNTLAPASLIAGVFTVASAWLLWRRHSWG
ncbi:hypothetical protein [Mycetocola sp. JXN-3]|uniref:hypothetical protein n=1 Tax=Mycetocola sp. JXN-3 TaxID=2116510 RepID=UPI00165CEF9E|nr:hypothetical protein [Mycetocola sp. JXN-3]